MTPVGLFIDPKGHYPALLPYWYDKDRDARTYLGPYPVVAHPPCQLWGNLAHLNFKRYGSEYLRPGNDGGCFAHALWSVESFGGVLEHPGSTAAYEAHGIARPPKQGGWIRTRVGWTCEVWQSAYGHKARKRTWLYYAGVRPPFDLDWMQRRGTHQIGGFDVTRPVIGKREASETPIAFAHTLIALAVWARSP